LHTDARGPCHTETAQLGHIDIPRYRVLQLREDRIVIKGDNNDHEGDGNCSNEHAGEDYL